MTSRETTNMLGEGRSVTVTGVSDGCPD